MTHEQQRIWLIEHLLDEDNEYRNIRIPSDAQKQKDLLRALMNVRPPAPLSPSFLEVQDNYLREENMRLRAELDLIKKVNALVAERCKPTRRSAWKPSKD